MVVEKGGALEDSRDLTVVAGYGGLAYSLDLAVVVDTLAAKMAVDEIL